MPYLPPRAAPGSYYHQHAECYYVSGASTGYEVYLIPVGDSATFTRQGDGGYINWAFQGPDGHLSRIDNVVNFF